MIRRLGFTAATLALALVGGGSAVAADDTELRYSPLGPASGSAALSVLDVAHRGASGYAPENTLAAIDAAKVRGATTVEIDVQRTKDGELVVFHDTTLERTTDAEEVFPGRGSYDVADFTLEEIRSLDAGSWFDPAFEGEKVPTFQEALDRLRKHGLNLLLEVKAPVLYPGIEADISETLARNPAWLVPVGKRGKHRLVIQSFDWASVKRSHDLLPTIPHGLLGQVPESEIDDYGEWADQINPSHKTLTADYVDAVHDEGMAVVTYTVNDADDMRKALDKGVDGLITDYPDIARQVIREHERSEAAEEAEAAA
ncbi:glycerophosphodiester phosphodiesterase family protein [Nocardiopsis sp. RSe5-2]|uniref:Glycerophosphodiester phosphodiesterase family protein n=1 Tax=Nocardiopsis endophytica TaxID=3018445 RepID=A0ABT4U3T1_9ACTN|nr:glycerophosphodiester phosphodiesterase family protein [Nocardiopsis endophytica]MDA2811100.1 glycerophosphodiester phosphodiesterase family protein [Nocardiopsis endophytica]